MQIGEIDHIAIADPVDDIAERAAEDHRERNDVALCLFARHPDADRARDECGDRHERPARRVGAAGEHRQRNAAIFGPGEVEDVDDLDHALRFQRQRGDDDPFGDLIEQEGEGRDQQAETPLFLPVSETRTANSSLSERQMVIVSNML